MLNLSQNFILANFISDNKHILKTNAFRYREILSSCLEVKINLTIDEEMFSLDFCHHTSTNRVTGVYLTLQVKTIYMIQSYLNIHLSENIVREVMSQWCVSS